MSRFQKWLFLMAALWGIPSWFLWLGVGFGTSILRDGQAEVARESLRTALDEFTLRSLPQEYLQKFSRDLLSDLSTRALSTGDCLDAATVARRGFPPGGMDLFLFDGQGICRMGDGVSASGTLEEFFRILRKPYFPAFDLPDTALAKKTLFGLPCSELHDGLRPLGPGKVVELEPNPWNLGAPDWGFFGLASEPFASQAANDRIGGLLAIFRKSILTSEFFFRQAMVASYPSSAAVGYWFDDRHFRAPPGFSDPEFLGMVAQFRSHPSALVSLDRRLVEGRFSHESAIVLASVELPSHPLWVQIFCFLAFAPLSFRFLVVLYRFALLDRPLALSLGNKILFLFFLALVFPLGIAAGLAGASLRDISAETKAESRASAFRSLEGIDAEFERLLFEQELLYRRWCKEFISGAVSREAFFGRFRKHAEAALIDDIYLLEADGTPAGIDRCPITASCRRLLLLPLPERRRVLKGMLEKGLREDRNVLRELYEDQPLERFTTVRFNPANERLFRQALTMVAREFVGGLQPPSSKPEVSITGFLTEDLRSLVEGVEANQGRLFCRSGARDLSYHFAEALQPPGSGSPLLILLTISGDSLQQEFLQRFFARRTERPERGRIKAIGYPRPVPRSFPDYDSDEPFRPILRLNSGKNLDRVVSRVEFEGQLFEACLLKARNLEKYHLAFLIPLEEYAQADAWRGRAALAFLFGFLGFGVLTASIFRRKLLVPFAAVSDGLIAIREKRFDHRIPVLSADELGQLCREFNLAIEHLREMEAAKIIQSSLYPHEDCVSGNFRISGGNRMTQAIGGDYYDVIPLADGRQAFILGDVSGHGVSAALVTAMAKAAFSLLLPVMGDDPARVLARISEAFQAILNKKKMMTCLLGILDPKTGKAVLYNAGQCFPLVIEISGGDGAPTFLQLSASPLGLLKKFRSASTEVDLNQHVLVLYSDGLIEATDQAGNVVGYEVFSRIVADLVREGRELDLEDIFSRVRAITDPIPWSDDATLLVVQRSPRPS